MKFSQVFYEVFSSPDIFNIYACTVDHCTWQYCPGSFRHLERENLTCPKLLELYTYIRHEAWVVGHLNSKDSFLGSHNKVTQGQLTYKHLKLNLEVVL